MGQFWTKLTLGDNVLGTRQKDKQRKNCEHCTTQVVDQDDHDYEGHDNHDVPLDHDYHLDHDDVHLNHDDNCSYFKRKLEAVHKQVGGCLMSYMRRALNDEW